MQKVYAYIDETGDRGASESASPIFGMAAILVREEDALGLRAAVDQLRSDLGVPDDKVMSWKHHIKTHDRRRRAAEILGQVPGVKVCYVYAKKAHLDPSSYVSDRERFYNYVALKMYKSVVWAAIYDMRAAEVHVRFGHVRHHDHAATKAYIQSRAPYERVPDDVVGSLRWVSADRYAESQAADVLGGFLKAATWPSEPYGYVEPSYLISVWPLLRRSEKCAIPLGMMSMPANGVLTTEPWFPCADCAKRPA